MEFIMHAIIGRLPHTELFWILQCFPWIRGEKLDLGLFTNVDLLGAIVEEITTHMYDNLSNLIFIVQSLRDMSIRHWIVKQEPNQSIWNQWSTQNLRIGAFGKKEKYIL